MKALLDSRTLLWWWPEPERLSPRASALIRDPGNSVCVSAATAWEIATKQRIGKLPGGGRIIEEWDRRIMVDRFSELAIASRHAFRAGTLPGPHRDPFDRMISAQGILEHLPVVSPDAALESLGVERIW